MTTIREAREQQTDSEILESVRRTLLSRFIRAGFGSDAEDATQDALTIFADKFLNDNQERSIGLIFHFAWRTIIQRCSKTVQIPGSKPGKIRRVLVGAGYRPMVRWSAERQELAADWGSDRPETFEDRMASEFYLSRSSISGADAILAGLAPAREMRFVG